MSGYSFVSNCITNTENAWGDVSAELPPQLASRPVCTKVASVWCVCQYNVASVAVLAEILLRSPQKLFIFIIKKNVCWVKVSKNKII